DVNGDGFADLIVGARGSDLNGLSSGIARVFSGSDGSIIHTFEGDSVGDAFGVSVSGAGDIDGDGFADLIVGANQNQEGASNVGYARVFSGCDVLGTSYCGPANLNSTGQSAVISACGSDLADGGYFMLHATDLPPSKFGYFLASETQAFVPFAGGSQGNLCLGGQIGRFAKQIQSSGASGELTIQVDLTQLPTPSGPHVVLAGETWNFQAWFRDVGNNSNFTDGISILFQ
ncbi:MAG: VCBS repeat-containing protein, partial [Chloroflexi bacterium]|nr:VCBS repeat-containing protein [Chloroflexota bacterium]